jgi:UDP-N-acetylglucosamine 4,6-dehydratase
LKRIEVGAYNPEEMVKTNIGGAMNVIEAARMSRQPVRVVALSTDKAYQPISAYGQSKALAESLFLAANETSRPVARFAVCRFGNVAGSTGSVIPKWRELARQGKPLPVTDPDCTRFWMSLDAAVAFVLDTAATMRGGELAIPALPAYRVGDLAEALGGALDVRGLNGFEKLHEGMSDGNTSDVAPRLSVDELRELLARV